MTPVLLDTDILSELIKLRNPVVRQHALAYTRQLGPLAFSAMTRYESVRSFKQQGAVKQLARFATFCQNSVVLPVDDAIFDRAADLWAYARTNGHPCNDADLLIAATALQHQRILVTGNTSHFAWVPGMSVIDWRIPTRTTYSPPRCPDTPWFLLHCSQNRVEPIRGPRLHRRITLRDSLP
jgi:tRNA(fMet)-specific endonuclease VapC